MNLANCPGCGRQPSYNHCISAHCRYDLVGAEETPKVFPSSSAIYRGAKLRCNRARCTCEITAPPLEVAYVYGGEVIARSRQTGTTFATSSYSNYETIGKIVTKCEAGDGAPYSMEIRYNFSQVDYEFWKLYPARPDLYPYHYVRAMNIYPTRRTIAAYKAETVVRDIVVNILLGIVYIACATTICLLITLMINSIIR